MLGFNCKVWDFCPTMKAWDSNVDPVGFIRHWALQLQEGLSNLLLLTGIRTFHHVYVYQVQTRGVSGGINLYGHWSCKAQWDD